MTRTKHYPAQANIPVYAVDFIDDETLLYAGGGGAGRSGVTNALVAAKLEMDKQGLEQIEQLKLSRDEDAPMTMAVDRASKQVLLGINQTADLLKAGKNDHLRMYTYDTEAKEGLALSPLKAVRALEITNPEHYQKVTTLSPDAKLLATASTDGHVALHRFPAMQPVWNSGLPDDFTDEVYDADFSESASHLVVTSSSKLVVYSTTPREGAETPQEEEKQVEQGYPQVVQTIKNPALGGKGPCSFRAAMFGRGDASREKLFTVVNAAPSAGRGPKAKIRKSFVTAWDADSWDLIETRHVSDRPVTVFDVSPDGKLLAYGSSDLSVGVLDAKTLRPILRILHAHDFPPTSLRFNPSSTLLVSASADNTLRVITIPAPSAFGALDMLTESRSAFYLTILAAFLTVLVALYAQKRFF